MAAVKVGDGKKKRTIGFPHPFLMPSQKSQPTSTAQRVFDMQLRTSRAVNPGAPDMPKPKRSTAEVTAEKTAKEDDKAAKAAYRQAAIKKVAALENTMVTTDANANLIANHPPALNKEKIVRKPVAVKDKGISVEAAFSHHTALTAP